MHALNFMQLEDEGKETRKSSVKTNNLPENSSIYYNMDKKKRAYLLRGKIKVFDPLENIQVSQDYLNIFFAQLKCCLLVLTCSLVATHTLIPHVFPGEDFIFFVVYVKLYYFLTHVALLFSHFCCFFF